MFLGFDWFFVVVWVFLVVVFFFCYMPKIENLEIW